MEFYRALLFGILISLGMWYMIVKSMLWLIR
jgi:hypothetical protein